MKLRRIKHIIGREFFTRIKKKTFLITTLLGPLVMLVMLVVPYWISSDHSEEINVVVEDKTGIVYSQLSSHEHIIYAPKVVGINQVKNIEIYIPTNAITNPETIEIHYSKEGYQYIEYVLRDINTAFYKSQYQEIEGFNVQKTYQPDWSKNSNKTGVRVFVAYGGGILLYFFIFLYGVQVMKGVVEEKSNRIIEVLVMVVKPFELMIGKILGIGLLGLTQFIIWCVFYGGFWLLFSSNYDMTSFSDNHIQQVINQPTINNGFAIEMNALFNTYSFSGTISLIGMFIFLFIAGYLMYGGLFAIVGAASDIDTDTQQFIFPLTVPLLASIVLLGTVIQFPEGDIAKMLAFIPFTSPITSIGRSAMLVETPSYWIEWIFIMIVNIVGFLFTTWIAAKVYRIGILSYGKKIGYKELYHWVIQR